MPTWAFFESSAQFVSARTVGVAVSAATVGVIYGYDSSNIGGALLFMTKEFNLSAGQQHLVTTAVVVGEVVGALFGGALANRIGRKRSMVGVAATFALFSLLSALAWSVPSLIVARLLLGLTIGVSVVVVPVFVAESAPQRIRGALLVMYQVATVTGIILGYLVAWGLAQTENWRCHAGSRRDSRPADHAGPAAAARHRPLVHDAGPPSTRPATCWRRSSPAPTPTPSWTTCRPRCRGARRGGVASMLRKPLLRATIFVVGLGFFVQTTGINAIVYYSPRIFEAMGFTGNAATLGLPALVQVAGLLAVFCSVALVDRLGRRPILLTGIGIMVAANALVITLLLRVGLRRRAHLARFPRPAGYHGSC